jgi:hypothetical protein
VTTTRPDALTVVQVNADLVLGCPACGAEHRLVTQPTPVLLDGIESFEQQHAICLLVEDRRRERRRKPGPDGRAAPAAIPEATGADDSTRDEVPAGDARDAAAAERDKASEANDQRSEARDKRSDARDERAAARDNAGSRSESAGAAWDRTEAKLDRQRSARDREHSGEDREHSGEDREAASQDRRGAVAATPDPTTTGPS